MKKGIIFILLLLIPALQGCGVGLLAAGVGTGVGMGRFGQAKIMEARGEYVDIYNNYRIELEKINIEREKLALKPVEIPAFDEWLKTQPLTESEIKLFAKIAEEKAKEKSESETRITAKSTQE